MKLTDKQYRDAIDWVVMVQRGRFPIERGHIDAIAAILLSPKEKVADKMYEELRRQFASQYCTCKLLPYVGEVPPCGTCKLGLLLDKGAES